MDDDYEYVPCDSCSCCGEGRCRLGKDCGPTCPCTND